MVAWHDLAEGSETDHDDWHSHEHMFERVGIAGFRRGRRCRSVSDDTESYFLMYEVDDFDVLTSAAYRARLNAPTEWSQRIIPTIRDMNRTLCRVRSSFGGGVGGYVLTVRFSDEAVADIVSGELAKRPGITGAHFLEGDADASSAKTDEARLRGGGDEIADLVCVVEGYDRAALERVGEELTEGGVRCGLYRTVHTVGEADLPG